MSDFDDDLSELESAEDFLDYFAIDYDPATVRVARLHILQRFHDYLEGASMPEDDTARRALYTQLLERAYRDFVESTPIDQRVFSVLKKAVGTATVSIGSIGKA
ncbi:nitrogenase-stabilizing/protective protein NifW [Endothiovibrio diazotrophicus]